MIFKGFKFGMLLQLAVGPMCLLVFNTAASGGFGAGLVLMSAIALIDLLFITLAGFGAGALLEGKNVRNGVKIFGALVLVVFGANMAAAALGFRLLPSVSLFSGTGGQNLFMTGLLLTASNPLTIIFWSGVFTAQIAENNYDRRQLCLFSLGCVLSTVVFLTLVAALGTTAGGFLPKALIRFLNIGVGCVLIFFGVRLFLRKN